MMRAGFLLTFSDSFSYLLLPIIIYRSHKYLYDSRFFFCELSKRRKDSIHRICFELLVSPNRKLIGFLQFHDFSSYDITSFKYINFISFFDKCIWIKSKHLFFYKEFCSFRYHQIKINLLMMSNIFKGKIFLPKKPPHSRTGIE